MEAEASGFLGVTLLGGAAAHLVRLEGIGKRNGPGWGVGAGREEMGNRLLALLSHQRPDLGRPAPRVPEDQPTAAMKDRCGRTHTHTHD